MLAKLEGSVLVLVDMQPSFLQPIDGGERVSQRCAFILEIAELLGVPILATEQYPSRMGGTDERLLPILAKANVTPYPKMSFSCAGCEPFLDQLESLDSRQVVLIGIETHICINQTTHELLDRDHSVLVCGDAVGARDAAMHEIGLERMRNAGAVIAHSESIAYEWLHTADNSKFKEALGIVKRFAAR